MNDDQKEELVYMGRTEEGKHVIVFIGKRKMTKEDILKSRELIEENQVMMGN